MLRATVTSDERRRHPRFDVSGTPGALDGFRLFETLKLSVGGMLIRLPAELTLDQHVRVELPLAEETFRSEARVVFVGPDLGATGHRQGERRYRVGLAFLEPAPAEQARLERFIAEQLAPRDPE
jgi:hypothetical protein